MTGSLVTGHTSRCARPGPEGRADVPGRPRCGAGRPAGDDSAGWCERPKWKQGSVFTPLPRARHGLTPPC